MVVLLTLMNVFFISWSIYYIKTTDNKFKIFFASVIIVLHFIGIVRNIIHYWNT